MSRKRWMAAVTAEAKKTGDDAYRALPFTRQARAEKRLEAAQPSLKKVSA